jgi:ribosomal protein S18 acetylase RimI-like enzyme
MSAIEIRPANSGDLATLIKMDHSCETNYVWQMESSSDRGQTEIRFRETRLPRSLRLEYPRLPVNMADTWTKHGLFLVARLADVSVGYLTLDIDHDNNLARVIDLVVDVNHRRKGIANALLVSAQKWLRTNGVDRVTIEVPAKNFAAISLARKLHYDFGGYVDNYYANRDIALFFTASLR